jgi:hypothetical protein
MSSETQNTTIGQSFTTSSYPTPALTSLLHRYFALSHGAVNNTQQIRCQRSPTYATFTWQRCSGGKTASFPVKSAPLTTPKKLRRKTGCFCNTFNLLNPSGDCTQWPISLRFAQKVYLSVSYDSRRKQRLFP